MAQHWHCKMEWIYLHFNLHLSFQLALVYISHWQSATEAKMTNAFLKSILRRGLDISISKN